MCFDVHAHGCTCTCVHDVVGPRAVIAGVGASSEHLWRTTASFASQLLQCAGLCLCWGVHSRTVYRTARFKFCCVHTCKEEEVWKGGRMEAMLKRGCSLQAVWGFSPSAGFSRAVVGGSIGCAVSYTAGATNVWQLAPVKGGYFSILTGFLVSDMYSLNLGVLP